MAEKDITATKDGEGSFARRSRTGLCDTSPNTPTRSESKAYIGNSEDTAATIPKATSAPAPGMDSGNPKSSHVAPATLTSNKTPKAVTTSSIKPKCKTPRVNASTEGGSPEAAKNWLDN